MRWSSMLVVALAGLLAILSTGCASRQKAGMAMPANYRQILERQRAIQTEQQSVFKDLPEMTAHDYGVAGDNHLRLGNLTAAFVQYDKALSLDPSLAHVRYKKAHLLLRRRMTQSAIDEFERILQDQPDYFLAHEGIGQAHLFQSNLDAAETHLQKAVAINNQLWKSYNYLGIIYDKRQQYDKAISFYKKAINISPTESLIYNNMGISLYRKQDFQRSSIYFKKALTYAPNNDKIHNNLGMTLASLGHYDDAIRAFTKSGGLAKAYNNIGVIYLSKGMYQEALPAFEKAIELNPDYYTKANDNLILTRQMLNTPPKTSPSR